MKKLVAMLLAAIMVLALCACGQTAAPAAAPAAEEPVAAPAAEEPATAPAAEEPAAEPIVLRMSTSATADSITAQAMNVWSEKTKEYSNGQLIIECYTDSTLYGQDDELEACMNGDLSISSAGPSWLAPYVDKIGMFSAAYIYKNVDHQMAVLNGDIGKNLYDEVAEVMGVRPLGAWYGGARVLSLRYDDKLVTTPQDMNGVVLRMPNSDAWLFLGKALGGNPTPLAFAEIYTSLQTGAIDAQDNPLPILESSKCYEVTKQIVLTNHVLDSVWPTINEEIYQSLSPELKDALLEGFNAATEYALKENLDAESKLVDFFKEQGITIVEPDVDAFMTYAADMYLNSDESAAWDMDLYNEIMELANQF